MAASLKNIVLLQKTFTSTGFNNLRRQFVAPLSNSQFYRHLSFNNQGQQWQKQHISHILPCQQRRTITRGQTLFEIKDKNNATEATTGTEYRPGPWPWADVPVESQIFVRSLPDFCTDMDLERCFSKVGKVIRSCVSTGSVENPFDGNNLGYGWVAFSTPREAEDAIVKLDGAEMIIPSAGLVYKGKITVEQSKFNDPTTVYIASRLPIRDIVDDVKKHVSTVGKVERIKVPKRPVKFNLHYCFVKFSTPQEAQDAVAKLNGSCLSSTYPSSEIKRKIYVQPARTSKTEMKSGN